MSFISFSSFVVSDEGFLSLTDIILTL